MKQVLPEDFAPEPPGFISLEEAGGVMPATIFGGFEKNVQLHQLLGTRDTSQLLPGRYATQWSCRETGILVANLIL